VNEYEELWKEHLHFPRIEQIDKKRKLKQENTFAITSKNGKKWKL